MGTVRVSCFDGVDKGALHTPLGVISDTATAAGNRFTGQLPDGTEVITIYAKEDHYVAVGLAPDATAQERMFIPAGGQVDLRLPQPASEELNPVGVAAATA